MDFALFTWILLGESVRFDRVDGKLEGRGVIFPRPQHGFRTRCS